MQTKGRYAEGPGERERTRTRGTLLESAATFALAPTPDRLRRLRSSGTKREPANRALARVEANAEDAGERVPLVLPVGTQRQASLDGGQELALDALLADRHARRVEVDTSRVEAFCKCLRVGSVQLREDALELRCRWRADVPASR